MAPDEEQGRADGSVDHRVVLAMGRADVEAGISLARSADMVVGLLAVLAAGALLSLFVTPTATDRESLA